jgi:hypothetical protein
MREICSELHQLMDRLPHYHFPFDQAELPQNGIYILFEKGEMAHGTNRIVRVGTHNGQNRLIQRLEEHFINENKDRSIFRKNIGRAMLNQNGDSFLAQWELDLTTREGKLENSNAIDMEKKKQLERSVSEYICANFSFCIIPVLTYEERMEYEANIISSVSNCHLCRPSPGWLGLYSPVEKIRESGMWNVNHLWKESLSWEKLEMVKRKLSLPTRHRGVVQKVIIGKKPMSVLEVVPRIKQKFESLGGEAIIPLMKGGNFIAREDEEGIWVDNLGSQPLLPWCVFQEAICVLMRNDGRAKRGNAMNCRLGDAGLPLDSIEGHIAQVVYGKQPGDSVFRRVTPIAAILVWAGICRAKPGELVLKDQ